MNREILFKAKRKDNGEWVEGYYAVKGKGTDCEKHFICVSTFDVNTSGYPFYFTDIEIEPETVCQYTGLTDKNGKKIWENEIVKQFADCNETGESLHYFYRIIWNEKYCAFEGVDIYSNESYLFLDLQDIEVIGNIFDNTELIGGKL